MNTSTRGIMLQGITFQRGGGRHTHTLRQVSPHDVDDGGDLEHAVVDAPARAPHLGDVVQLPALPRGVRGVRRGDGVGEDGDLEARLRVEHTDDGRLRGQRRHRAAIGPRTRQREGRKEAKKLAAQLKN